MAKNNNTYYFDIFVILILLVVSQSCEIDKNRYSDVPFIEFIDSKESIGLDDLEVEVYKLQIEFYLIDGDGDVGLPNGELPSPYIGDSAFNFFPILYYFEKGELILDTIATIDTARNFIIPSVEKVGLDKTLKANVYIDFEYSVKLFPYDSIMYSFYVMDRAFNKSNIEWTDTIVFPVRKKRKAP